MTRESGILENLQIPGIPKIVLNCGNVEYVVEDIDGYPLCDGEYGTDDDCLNLVKLRKLLLSQMKSNPLEIERRLWTLIERFSALLLELQIRDLWIEDIR